MSQVIVDSGAASLLAARSREHAAAPELRAVHGDERMVVPSVVLVECLQGKPHTDVLINRFLKSCQVRIDLPERLARRAGALRAAARTGSAVDAVVVALAEPGGTVLTTDLKDCRALAAHAQDVKVLAA